MRKPQGSFTWKGRIYTDFDLLPPEGRASVLNNREMHEQRAKLNVLVTKAEPDPVVSSDNGDGDELTNTVTTNRAEGENNLEDTGNSDDPAGGSEPPVKQTSLPDDFPGRTHLVEANIPFVQEVAKMTHEELVTVPGIGPMTASHIIDYLANLAESS